MRVQSIHSVVSVRSTIVMGFEKPQTESALVQIRRNRRNDNWRVVEPQMTKWVRWNNPSKAYYRVPVSWRARATWPTQDLVKHVKRAKKRMTQPHGLGCLFFLCVVANRLRSFANQNLWLILAAVMKTIVTVKILPQPGTIRIQDAIFLCIWKGQKSFSSRNSIFLSRHGTIPFNQENYICVYLVAHCGWLVPTACPRFPWQASHFTGGDDCRCVSMAVAWPDLSWLGRTIWGKWLLVIFRIFGSDIRCPHVHCGGKRRVVINNRSNRLRW